MSRTTMIAFRLSVLVLAIAACGAMGVAARHWFGPGAAYVTMPVSFVVGVCLGSWVARGVLDV
jgi:hypothetical protein